MCLLRNNSVSAYGARVYLEMFHACWKAWFAHSMLLCSFTSKYKMPWLQQFALQPILFTTPFLIQRCFVSLLTPTWPEFNKWCMRNKKNNQDWMCDFILKNKVLQITLVGNSNQNQCVGLWCWCTLQADACCMRLFFRPLSSWTLWCVWKKTHATACVPDKLISLIRTPQFIALILH